MIGQPLRKVSLRPREDATPTTQSLSHGFYLGFIWCECEEKHVRSHRSKVRPWNWFAIIQLDKKEVFGIRAEFHGGELTGKEEGGTLCLSAREGKDSQGND